MTAQLEDTKKNSEKLIDTLKAVLEETDIRIADLKKEAYEFKRDIVVGAENMRTGNTMAEKVRLLGRTWAQLSVSAVSERHVCLVFRNEAKGASLFDEITTALVHVF